MGMQSGSCSCVAPEVQGSSLECAVLILLAPSTAALPSLHPPGSNAARSTWEVEVEAFPFPRNVMRDSSCISMRMKLLCFVNFYPIAFQN